MRIKDIKDEQFVSNSLYGEGKVVGRTDDSIDVLFKDNEIVTFKSRGNGRTQSTFDFIMSKLFKDKK
jgi:hypothetical protein